MARMSEGSGWKTRNLSRNPFQNGSIFHSHDIVDQLILGKLLSGKLLNKALTSLTGLFLIWGNIQRLFHKESLSTDEPFFSFSFLHTVYIILTSCFFLLKRKCGTWSIHRHHDVEYMHEVVVVLLVPSMSSIAAEDCTIFKF